MKNSNYGEQFKSIRRILPYFSLLIFLAVSSLEATELTYKFKDYQEAKKSEKFIKFEGRSTKLGFISTAFNGYAKDFNVHYNSPIINLMI